MPPLGRARGPTWVPSSTSIAVNATAKTGIGIHADVQLAPGSACLGAVLLDQPLARAEVLQADAAHRRVYGLAIIARSWARHLQRLRPTAERRVVRDCQSEPVQVDDGTDQPLGLPQRQTGHDPDRQCRQDSPGATTSAARPGPCGLAFQTLTASSVNHTVKLPRRHKKASYAAELVTLCFCFGMWRRRSWFSLNGKAGIRGSEEG
jgi:hypothetical protein